MALLKERNGEVLIMQVHYYKTTWGRAWQKHNQKKHGYNPKYADVKPRNKRRYKKGLQEPKVESKSRLEVLAERKQAWLETRAWN